MHLTKPESKEEAEAAKSASFILLSHIYHTLAHGENIDKNVHDALWAYEQQICNNLRAIDIVRRANSW